MTNDLKSQLIINLSSLLNSDFLLLAKLVEQDSCKTERIYSDGVFLENFSYSLEKTPCERVTKNECCIYDRGVAALFPQDSLLTEMGISAYVGVPIQNSDNQVVAILVALYRNEIHDVNNKKCLMESFSLSMSAEYSRHEKVIQLEQIKQDLKKQVSILQHQQELLNQAQRIAKFASYEIDTVKGEINWSKGVENILFIDVALEKYSNLRGISVDEPWMEYIVDKDKELVSRTLKSAINEAKPYRIKYTSCLPSGVNKIMIAEGVPVTNEKNRVIAIRGFLQDISEIDLVETELINREKRLVSLFDNSPLGIIEWNLDFTIKDWNPEAEQVFGWSKAEVVNTVGDFILPDDIKVDVGLIWQDLIHGRGGLHSINTNKTKSGSEIIVEWRNASIYGANNEVVSVVSYVEDITRKYHEEELTKQLEEKFSTIFSACQDAITVTRKATGEFVDVNEGFERITGYSREDAIGKTSLDLSLIDEDDRNDYLTTIFDVGHISNIELKFRNKSGQDIYGIYSAKTVTINNEDLIIAYCHDITERK